MKTTLIQPKKQWKETGEVPNVVGKLDIYRSGETIDSVPIYFEKQAEQQKGFFDRVKRLMFIQSGAKTDG